jgi:hypothetical protein
LSNVIYNKFKQGLLQGSYALGTSTLPIYVALVNNSYTPNIDTDLYSTTPLVYQIVGTNYTAGGVALSSPNIELNATKDAGVLWGSNIRWDDASFTARWAILYGSSGAGMASDPLICAFDFAADKTVAAGTFEIQWSANGIIQCT